MSYDEREVVPPFHRAQMTDKWDIAGIFNQASGFGAERITQYRSLIITFGPALTSLAAIPNLCNFDFYPVP